MGFSLVHKQAALIGSFVKGPLENLGAFFSGIFSEFIPDNLRNRSPVKLQMSSIRESALRFHPNMELGPGNIFVTNGIQETSHTAPADVTSYGGQFLSPPIITHRQTPPFSMYFKNSYPPFSFNSTSNTFVMLSKPRHGRC